LVDISDLSTEQSSSVFVKQDNNTVALFKLFRNENILCILRDMFLEQAPASVYKDSDFDAANETIEQFRWRQSKDLKYHKKRVVIGHYRVRTIRNHTTENNKSTQLYLRSC
jgi:hypothetical protein